MEKLAKDSDYQFDYYNMNKDIKDKVYCGMARNPNVSQEILFDMFDKYDCLIDFCNNPNIPKQIVKIIIDKLKVETDEQNKIDILMCLGYNKVLEDTQVRFLYNYAVENKLNDCCEILSSLCMNPNTPEDILEEMYKTDITNTVTSTDLALHPKLPPVKSGFNKNT